MREFVSIQYLRGLAALLVVIYHLQPPLLRLGYNGPWLPGLSGGVDIFFVISGFVMWMSTRDRAITPTAFWWKRFLRIAPLYWLVTTFMLVVVLIAPSVLRSSAFDLKHTAFSYLFLPAIHPVKHVMEPLVFPGWTLNYEMFFYAIFGLSLITKPERRLPLVAGAIVGLVVLGVVVGPAHVSLLGFYTSDLMVEFAAGMIIGELLHRRNNSGLFGRSLGFLAVLAGLAALVMAKMFGPLPRAILFGVPATLIVVGALSVELSGGVRRWRIAEMLGNASYSIYLTQLITMAAFFAVVRKLPWDRLTGGLLFFCVIDVLAAIIFGVLTYRLVERPLIKYVRGRTKPQVPVDWAT